MKSRLGEAGHRVVVIGGGYGGVSFISELRKHVGRQVDVTLIDRYDSHTLLTETHTVAAGHRPAGAVRVPFATLLPGLRVHQGTVREVDQHGQVVHTDQGSVPYDTLVFSLGGRDNDFGVPGVSADALMLRGWEDAERIRERAQSLPEGAGVVIVGGGLTGVELAAEMAQTGGHRLSITVVEAHPHLLHGLPAALQDRARRRLGWLGVNVMLRGAVAEMTDDHVAFADGTRIRAGLVVWAAGVKGHPLAQAMGLAVDRAGRAVVDGSLRGSLPNVYAIGDSAAWRPSAAEPALPPSAQLAGQMGISAAQDLISRLRGGNGRTFVPHLQGVLCDLGGLNATGLVYRFQVGGILGAIAKRASVWRHLLKVGGLRALLFHLSTVWQPGPGLTVSSPDAPERVE